MKAVLSVLLVAAAACSTEIGEPGGDDAPGTPDPSGGNNGNNDGSMTYVFAHTATELYKVDPDTLQITRVGPFQWVGAADQMTDLAIDKTGRMIGVSFSSVYQVDPRSARTTLLSSGLQGSFNGLSFVT